MFRGLRGASPEVLPAFRRTACASVPLRLQVHFRKEALCYIGVQQPVAVLRKHGVVSDRFVHAQADEPAKQQVVVDLLDQQAFRTHGEEDLQLQRSQHRLRRYRRTARSCVKLVGIRIERCKNSVRQPADRAQRMILRHLPLKGNIAKQSVLGTLFAAHVI